MSLASSKHAYVLGLSLWYKITGTIRHMMAFDVPTELWVMLAAFECADSATRADCKGCDGLCDD